MTAIVLQGNAMALPLPDECVDLVVTSPPYFGLRLYTDDGRPVPDQVGGEATPGEFIDALIAATSEMVRVLKPSGSIFVNLGDKYSQRTQTRRSSHQPGMFTGKFPEFEETWAAQAAAGHCRMPQQNTFGDVAKHVPEKSLMLLPERYRIAAVDRLGLIARAVIVWDKPNGLPESAKDRVRRSHEDWVHLTKQPRYFSAIDEIREPQQTVITETGSCRYRRPGDPLGKLPNSVWRIATSPLRLPAELGVDHFAAFPPAWPKRIIQGWSPADGIILDPFGGTGTTAMVAHALRRTGISVDLSHDYCRVAQWRTADAKQLAKVTGTKPPKRAKPPAELAGQLRLT
jgi:DNA modification methylase